MESLAYVSAGEEIRTIRAAGSKQEAIIVASVKRELLLVLMKPLLHFICSGLWTEILSTAVSIEFITKQQSGLFR